MHQQHAFGTSTEKVQITTIIENAENQRGILCGRGPILCGRGGILGGRDVILCGRGGNCKLSCRPRSAKSQPSLERLRKLVAFWTAGVVLWASGVAFCVAGGRGWQAQVSTEKVQITTIVGNAAGVVFCVIVEKAGKLAWYSVWLGWFCVCQEWPSGRQGASSAIDREGPNHNQR